MESIPSIFLSLFDVGDQFIRSEDEGSGKLPIGNDQRVAQIILQLLRRLPWDSRFDALRQAITQGRAVFISAKIVMELGKLSDKHAGEERPKAEALIRHDDLLVLEELVLAKIRNAATDESLLKCPKLPEILSLWQDLAGDAEPITWVNQVGARRPQLSDSAGKIYGKGVESLHAPGERRSPIPLEPKSPGAFS